MTEWVYLYNLIGPEVISTWQFGVGLTLGSLIMLTVASIVSLRINRVSGFLLSIPGHMGLTVLIGFTSLGTYAAMLQKGQTLEASAVSVIPYIFLGVVIVAWFAFYWKQGSQNEVPMQNSKL